MTTNNNLPVEPIKIFGENAGQNIGQFGSALTGTPNRTGDIEQIQALNAWGNGWAGGVISERNYPALEEMTGIQKVLSYHLAYIKQKGICEWDSTVTYFANTGFCQVNGVVYQSITDNNIGNNPTEDKESTHWKKVDLGGANTDLSNLTEEGEKHFLNKSQVTNCLLEIPQRVNVELNDGTLTLKAGFVVIVPYGTSEPTLEIGASLNGGEIVDISWDEQKLFYYVKYDEDINYSYSPAGTYQDVVCITNNGSCVSRGMRVNFSGDTVPTFSGNYATWYDTANNIVKWTDTSGSSWNEYNSLPFCIASVAPSLGFTSIDNIFNGFGFMGSILWFDKGIKGLVSNGRNADGSLRNDSLTLETVLLSGSYDTEYNWTSQYGYAGIAITTGNTAYTAAAQNAIYIVKNINDLPKTQKDWAEWGIVSDINYIVQKLPNSTEWTLVVKDIFPVKFYYDSTLKKITQLDANTAFKALDYNDTEYISNQASPSSSFISVALLASGQSYIAPCDCTWCFSKATTANKQFTNLYCPQNNMQDQDRAETLYGEDVDVTCKIKLKKGQTVIAEYNAGGTLKYFGYIPDEGAM